MAVAVEQLSRLLPGNGHSPLDGSSDQSIILTPICFKGREDTMINSINLIRFHLDVALELLSKVLVKVRVVPLSNLSHVPSLQSLNLPPSNFGLGQQRYCILVAWVHIASFGQWLDRQSVLILITALRLLVAYPYQLSSSRWSRLRHCLPVRCNPTAQTAQL